MGQKKSLKREETNKTKRSRGHITGAQLLYKKLSLSLGECRMKWWPAVDLSVNNKLRRKEPMIILWIPIFIFLKWFFLLFIVGWLRKDYGSRKNRHHSKIPSTLVIFPIWISPRIFNYILYIPIGPFSLSREFVVLSTNQQDDCEKKLEEEKRNA